MESIMLNSYMAFPWYNEARINFRGWFLYENEVYKGLNAIHFINLKSQSIPICKLLGKLNGSFSIIINSETEILIATDVLRTLPLFYSIFNGQLFVSDSANELYNTLPRMTFDKVSYEDLSSSTIFVSGPYTLFNEINLVQAGEFVIFNKQQNSIERAFYFEHADGIIDHLLQEPLLVEFDRVFHQCCNNFKQALNNRTAVVPLSGGVDSREVLLMLKTIGYEKVLCYTYGKKGNREVRIAQQLAELFEFSWFEVPYTRKQWKDLYHSNVYADYQKIAGNFAGLPHTQDLLATKIVIDNGLVPKDCVFIPGHAGAITGGNLDTDFLNSSIVAGNQFMMTILKNYPGVKTISGELLDRLGQYFNWEQMENNDQSSAQHHNFMMRERQAKFIVNSVRVYEFFGYEWLLPLCDLGFIEFFKKLPLELKADKKFVRLYMRLDAIQTTSDMTIKKRVFNQVKRIPPLANISKRFNMVQRYFTSTLQSEGRNGFLAYIGFVFSKRWKQGTNSVATKAYLALLKEK